MVSTLYILNHLIFITTLGGRYCYYPHFTYVETETQSTYVTALRSQVFEPTPKMPCS